MVTTTLNVVIPEEEQSLNVLEGIQPTTVGTVATEEEINRANYELDPNTSGNEALDEANAMLADQQSSILDPVTQVDPQPTVVSTDTMRDQLAEAEKTLKDLSAQIAAGELVGPDSVTKEAPSEDKTISQIIEGEEEDPLQTEIDEYTTSSQKLIDDRKRDFERYLTRSDNLLKSQIRSINATFDVRRQQAQDVADNAKRASQVLGARTGRTRYAPEIQRGILTGQENALIKTLSEIDALELAAIAAAEEAAFDRDYDTFLDQIDNLDTLRREREATLKDLNDVMKEENEKRKKEAEDKKNEISIIEEIANGITDPIKIFQNLGGQVPYETIKTYTDAMEGGSTELEFIRGDKYTQSGYFNPITGEFVTVAGRGGGGVTGGGVTGGGGLPLGPVNMETIDTLNISEAAKNYVRSYLRGDMDIAGIQAALARQGTSAEARRLTNEVMSVISRIEAPEVEVDQKIQDYLSQQSDYALDAIDDILDIMNVTYNEETGEFSWRSLGTEATATYRALFDFFPGSDANAIDKALRTVKATIGFEALQEMRNNSPTGGALGQVTELELALLQSTVANIDADQETGRWLKNLFEVKEHFEKIKDENDGTATGKVPNFKDYSLDELINYQNPEAVTTSSDPNGIF